MKQKRRWSGKPTVYSVLVLLVLLGTALKLWHQEENPLLKEKTAITLYREVHVGQVPEFRTEDFFAGEKMDYEKVTYDTSGCDYDTPGIYLVPVLYDGQDTNCVVEVTVKADETERVEDTTGDGTVLRQAEE